MNPDVRIQLVDGERAVRRGDLEAARACFIEAGDTSFALQLWRSAVRCYRHALELDLVSREVVERILRVPARVISGRGWDEYRAAIDTHAWPHFHCRGAQVVIGDLGAVVECHGVGPVLELIMTDADLVESRPAARFAGMPIAMAMLVLRRALWTHPRERDGDGEAMSVRVAYEGRQQVRLDEVGDWDPVMPSRRA